MFLSSRRFEKYKFCQFQNLTPGQGQGQGQFDLSRSYDIWKDASRRGKHFGTGFESLRSSCHELLANNYPWPWMTFQKVTDENLHPGHWKGPKMTWYWNNWIDIMRFRMNLNFSPYMYNGRTRNWPDLRSLNIKISTWNLQCIFIDMCSLTYIPVFWNILKMQKLYYFEEKNKFSTFLDFKNQNFEISR